MLPPENCPFFLSKGRHLYVPYTVKATGKQGEACYGCGKNIEDDD